MLVSAPRICGCSLRQRAARFLPSSRWRRWQPVPISQLSPGCFAILRQCFLRCATRKMTRLRRRLTLADIHQRPIGCSLASGGRGRTMPCRNVLDMRFCAQEGGDRPQTGQQTPEFRCTMQVASRCVPSPTSSRGPTRLEVASKSRASATERRRRQRQIGRAHV